MLKSFVICFHVISANVLEIHCLQLAHNLAEVWSLIRIVIPAALHQVEEGTWRISFRDLGPEALFDDALTYDLAIDAVVGGLTRGQLPHNHAKREHVRLLSVLEALDDLRRHPLVGSDLACHDLSLDPGPTEVGQFCGKCMIKQDVQTL